MPRRYIEIISLFIASLFIFTYGLSQQEIIGFDSRFYLFALEMWRHGFSWFPTTYHQPYPDYPGASTWLIYLTSLLCGTLNKLTAILPSAMMAAGTVCLTYLIGEVQHKRWGIYAVCMLLMTAGFIREARAISLDMYVTFVTTACFYLLIRDDKQHQRTSLLLFSLLLIFGFFIRGPIGLVIPTSVICIYYLTKGQLKKTFIAGIFAACLLLLCSTILLSLARYVGGQDFVQDVIRMEIAGRLNDYHFPVYFYFLTSLSNYSLGFPFALLSILGIIYYRLFKRVSFSPSAHLHQLIGWILVVLIGMSIPGEKKIRYILPIMPAIALLATYPMIANSRLVYFRFLKFILERVSLYIPGLLMVGLMYIYQDLPTSEWTASSHYLSVIMILAMLQLGNIIAWSKLHSSLRTMIISALAFIIVYIFMFEPAELNVERAHHFVQSAEITRLNNASPLIFYKEQLDGLPIKYIINMRDETQPVFLQDSHELIQAKKGQIILMRQAEFEHLPPSIANKFTVISHDKMGHVEMIAVQKRK